MPQKISGRKCESGGSDGEEICMGNKSKRKQIVILRWDQETGEKRVEHRDVGYGRMNINFRHRRERTVPEARKERITSSSNL